jgi:hypothetical protein
LAGANKETLMVKLGHADFRTTQRYSTSLVSSSPTRRLRSSGA